MPESDNTSKAGTAVSASNVQAVDASVAIEFSPAAEEVNVLQAEVDTELQQSQEKDPRRQSPRKSKVLPGTLCIFIV